MYVFTLLLRKESFSQILISHERIFPKNFDFFVLGNDTHTIIYMILQQVRQFQNLYILSLQ